MTRSVDTEIKRVTVTLSKRQLDALQVIATREDVSVAWLVRKAVDKLLRQGPELPVADGAQPEGFA
jgi:predicted DNA-binding ribbon-helix-helix protein